METAGFLSGHLNGPIPYDGRHITVKKYILSALLNKTFPSFLPSISISFDAFTANATLSFALCINQGWTIIFSMRPHE